MRSLNFFQNPQDRTIPSLASQFIDMLDASKIDTSLLRKRELQTHDNIYQMQLQKKIKTPTINSNLTIPSPLQLTGLNPMLYNLNSQFNPLLAVLGGNQTYGLQADIARASQLQNLALLNQQKDALLTLQPLSFSSTKKDQVYVKQEYVKQEELPISQGTPNTKLTVQEDSPVADELQVPAMETTEPALTEFTRAFPDWDLATIFEFLRSGKSQEVFEKEKQCKIERKLRRKKLRMAQKEKEMTTQQNKATKGKRVTGKTQ